MSVLERVIRWRRTRWVVAVVAALLAVHLTARIPAYADNCSVFTDCFGQANTAGEAALGLLLLSILSLVLDFVPVVGTVKGVVEAATGEDLLTGERLEPWERALGLIPWGHLGELGRLGRLGGDFAGVGRGGDELANLARRSGELGRIGRAGDEVGGIGRAGDEVGGVGRGGDVPPLSKVGDRAPLDPRHQPLVDEYAGATKAGRSTISEQLGEAGALQHLQSATGRPDLRIVHPQSDAEVAGFADLTANVPWDHAVAFNGSRVTNVVCWDGKTLRVIEAKGGDSAYGDRVARHIVGDENGRISQTDPRYPEDVAGDMVDSSRTDGRNEIGEAIARAARTDTMEYVGVRTGPRAAILEGRPEVIVMDVFRRPGGGP